MYYLYCVFYHSDTVKYLSVEMSGHELRTRRTLRKNKAGKLNDREKFLVASASLQPEQNLNLTH